jgi:hypothetical protein
MSKNSHKTRYTQLMEWLPTLSSKRKKHSKSNNNRRDGYKQR